MGRLDGKVAVITGGASGMGESTAQLFVREGARVVIGDLQKEKGEAVAAGIGKECRFVATDVSSSEDVRGLVRAAVEGFGRIDIMYNNAGIGGGEGSIVDCTRGGVRPHDRGRPEGRVAGDEALPAIPDRERRRVDHHHGVGLGVDGHARARARTGRRRAGSSS